MSNELVVVGVSHRTAPVELRERLAVSHDRRDRDLRALLEDGSLQEGVLVSTCNRVELITAARTAGEGIERARAYLDTRAAPEPVHHYIYQRVGPEAVRHLFRVASGLDSMVLGEPQILGQVKDAFQHASDQGAVGTLLGRWFEHAFGVAKRVRSETGLAQGLVSVSSIACDLAEKIFGELRRRRVLLLGAGKMSEAAARSLAARGAILYVLNRSPERAEQLADACGGTARPLESLAAELTEADVVISSTSNPGFVITRELMHDVMKARRRRPIFLIDIAVPRDVDPRSGDLENVFLYDIDDLQQVSRENLAARQSEVADAEAIVDDEVLRFEAWLRTLRLKPTIVALRERFRGVVRAELESTLPRLSSLEERDRRTLEKMCDAMVNKLLHAPVTRLKDDSEDAAAAQLIEMTQRLFDLQIDSGEQSSRRAHADTEEREQPPSQMLPTTETSLSTANGRGGGGRT